MPAKTTYKDLFRLVDEQIENRTKFNTSKGYKRQLDRIEVAPLFSNPQSDIRTSEVVTAVQSILSEALPSFIIEGLEVSATDPATSRVNITAGKGTKGGALYTLEEDVALTVPFDGVTEVFFVNIYKDRIMIDKNTPPSVLTVAKIIVPFPGVTNRVLNDKDYSFDAYISSFKEFKLYGNKFGKLEEDSLEFLRDNISEVLADNIIGNIRLSENLRITNIAGSLELDGDSLKIKNASGNVLSKFTRDGSFIFDEAGREIAKFTGSESRIGNIKVTSTSLQSANFVEGSTGFRIRDNGDVEFNNLTVRGTIYATAGEIGGWTIASNKIYANPNGALQTGANVGAGSNGVILDRAGLRVYDDVLGIVANFPSDGSVPTISSGIIREVIFEISTNSILRTSETVGDGSANSYGVLINNTGLYGCGADQLLADANFKILTDGSVYLKGEIVAESGRIGGITITADKLVGGTIEGATLIGTTIQTDDTLPRIRIDSSGIMYEVTGAVGKYNTFMYGSGTKYGSGVLAKLFDATLPVLTILSEQNIADIRLYDRSNEPVTGSHKRGDLICVNGTMKRCKTAGSPGDFDALVSSEGTTGFKTGATAGDYVIITISGVNYKVLTTP